MAEMTPNDSAMIKVSIELRQLENGILIAQMVKDVVRRHQVSEERHSNMTVTNPAPWETRVKGVDFSTNCSPEMKGFVGFLKGIQEGFDEVDVYLTKAIPRAKELRKLVDAYTEGKDIVAEKLKG